MPDCSNCDAASAHSGGMMRPERSRRFTLPTYTSWPSTIPCTPEPGRFSNDVGRATSRFLISAASTTARPIGCSDDDSRDPANLRSVDSSPSASTSVTCMRPLVRVPVLSKSTIPTPRERSNSSAPLKTTPRRAPRPLPTMIAVGVARPSAHGQATTSTATPVVRERARSPLETMYHTTDVNAATPITIGTKMPATVSASFCTGALVACASSTRWTICARAVSVPTRVALTRRFPCWLIVAPKTSSPAPLSTGSDSPVSMLSSSDDVPSTIVPSVGIFSPGRTTMRSPRCSSATGSMTSESPRRILASFAPSSIRVLIACEARPFALASKNLPRRMKVTIAPAVSKNRGLSTKNAHTE